MNSFNHYSFGAVGAWLIEYSLGIRCDENNVGFRHFILAPETDPTGEITFARGHFDSPYGRIESSWKTENGKIIYNFTVPKGTTATLYLPKNAKIVGARRTLPTKPSPENDKAKFTIKAGKYEFYE